MNAEAKNIIQVWWDEGLRWKPGVTSRVLADYLEEHEDSNATEENLLWLRGVTGYPPGDIVGTLDMTAGVYGISVGTAANPALWRMIYDFQRELRVSFSYQVAAQAKILLGYDTAGMVARSREFKDYMYLSPFAFRDFNSPNNPMLPLGLPRALYGMFLVLNEHQPEGTIDCVCGDHIITARVY